jgi:hypothetical protein
VRALALLIVTGVALGVVIAILVHAVHKDSGGAAQPECTADEIALAPTIAIHGRLAHVGLLSRFGNCVVSTRQPKLVRVVVVDANGAVVLDRSGHNGPAPGTTINTQVEFSVPFPAALLCAARQPLRFGVTALGVSTAGEQTVRLEHGHCVVAS